MFTPSLVPASDDTVFIVEDNFGSLGRCYSETDIANCDRASTLNDLYSGQYNDPVRVVAFNTREGWSRDVSSEFARELQHRADLEIRELSGTLAAFVDAYSPPDRQLALRLV